MRTITIRCENGKVSIIMDGVLLGGVHSFSVDYLKGMPLQISCVADLTDGKREREMYS